MRLNPARFNRHLANIGQEVRWRRSYACACVGISGQPDPKHKLCNGKGVLWAAPIDTYAGVSHQTLTPELAAAGNWDIGELVLTIQEASAMWEFIGKNDRVLLKNSTDVFSSALKRGSPTERILFSVKDFQRVFWLDPVTRNPVEGGLPQIDAMGNLSWPAGDGPPDGFPYSLTGMRFDEYYVFKNNPQDRGEHNGARLPKRVELKAFDLFNRSIVSA